LQEKLLERGKPVVLLDGDDFRRRFANDLGFSKEDRRKNIERAGAVAEMFSECGYYVICAFISPEKAVRDRLKGDNFIEVYVHTPLEICEKRDVKGLYKRARKGEIEEFTGVSAPYDIPSDADVTVFTETEDVESCANIILDYLNGHTARAFYIGRWQCIPLHEGHEYIINESLRRGIPVLIGVRDMLPDSSNPYSPQYIKQELEKRYKDEDVEVVIIPNIRSVNIGRKVGYDIVEINAPEKIEDISATKIREEKDGDRA
jgi:adenylylsulfate kinase